MCVCGRSVTELPGGSLTRSVVLLRGAQVSGGGGDSSQSQLEIYSLNRSSPRLVKTVSTRADVLCLEYVREQRAGPAAQTVATPGNIICAGLQDGRWVCSRGFMLEEKACRCPQMYFVTCAY